MAVVAILAGILFPVFARAREASRRASCVSNLRQIGIGFALYVDDWRGMYPCSGDYRLWQGRYWRWLLAPYLARSLARDAADASNPLVSNKATEVLRCGSDAASTTQYDGTSYGYSACFFHSPEQIAAMQRTDFYQPNVFAPVAQASAAVEQPAAKVLAAEWTANHSDRKATWWASPPAGERACLFADGRAEVVAAGRMSVCADGSADFNRTRGGIGGSDLLQ